MGRSTGSSTIPWGEMGLGSVSMAAGSATDSSIPPWREVGRESVSGSLAAPRMDWGLDVYQGHRRLH